MPDRIPTDAEAEVLAFYVGDNPDGWDAVALNSCLAEVWVAEDPVFDMTDITDTGRAALAAYHAPCGPKEATTDA